MTTIEPHAIELGARHKAGLRLASPVMVAAGCYGFGKEYNRLVEGDALGALVVGPVTLRPRKGAAPPRAVPIPGGVLLHTGLENPGLPAVLRRHRRVWERSPAPIVVHLAATSPHETAAACERLRGEEAVAALELGLADHVTTDEAAVLVSAAATAYSYRPLLVRLPAESASALAAAIAGAGADVLTVAAPPRGTVRYRNAWVTGRLYGGVVLPMTMRKLRRVARSVDLPLVGCGGVRSADDALILLQAGAAAVQIDSALWKDPSSPARIARELNTRSKTPS
jgi:dihydroorotate dehydrogenase (NAD+) catalytic subunit